jgi:hypothetical protein
VQSVKYYLIIQEKTIEEEYNLKKNQKNLNHKGNMLDRTIKKITTFTAPNASY